MKNEKDISTWFKKNADQANETPSDEVWNRLENELHEPKSKAAPIQWWKLATGIAAMLLISIVLINPFNKPSDIHLVMNEDSSSVVATAELEHAKTSRSADDSIRDFKTNTEEQPVAALLPIPPAEISIENISKSSGSGIEGSSVENQTILDDEEETTLSAHKIEEAVVAEDVFAFAEPIEELEETVIVDDEMEFKKEGIGYSADDIVVAEQELDIESNEEKLIAQTASRSGRDKKVMASKPTILNDRMSGTPASQRGSANLDWLVGEWQEIRTDQTIVENWMRVNDNEWIGEGYAISKNDTIFYEQLKISSFNGQVILQMQVDQASPPVNFQLVRNDGSIAVFNNYEIDFPNEIVYERMGDDLLNATFRSAQSNGNLKDSNNVNNRNINYLQQRNNISNTEMYRNMKRSTN